MGIQSVLSLLWQPNNVRNNHRTTLLRTLTVHAGHHRTTECRTQYRACRTSKWVFGPTFLLLTGLLDCSQAGTWEGIVSSNGRRTERKTTFGAPRGGYYVHAERSVIESQGDSILASSKGIGSIKAMVSNQGRTKRNFLRTPVPCTTDRTPTDVLVLSLSRSVLRYCGWRFLASVTAKCTPSHQWRSFHYAAEDGSSIVSIQLTITNEYGCTYQGQAGDAVTRCAYILVNCKRS